MDLLPLADRLATHLDWTAWEALVERHGITIDRPHRSRHPSHPEIVYPIDYGYVHDTLGTDGDGLDVFVGTGEGLGLVGLALTHDRRRGDREAKLLWQCTPEEVYLVHGFLNLAPRLMTATLVLRRPLHEVWDQIGT